MKDFLELYICLIMYSNLIFVYGTLRRGFNLPVTKALEAGSMVLDEIFVPGYLFDLGEYPGMVYDTNSSQTVFGELLFLTDINILPLLDQYEGIGISPEYSRQIIPYKYRGIPIQFWQYNYLLPTLRYQLIESGDYKTYLANKN